jgi:subtilase family serine protease
MIFVTFVVQKLCNPFVTDVPLPTVPWTVRGYTPDQIKGAYGISPAYDGAGQTVAIIDAYASPTILQDVNQWSTNRGLPTMSPSQLVQVVPPGVYRRPQNPRQDPQGWYGEETLDVEAVHGMAPAAKIVFVGAPNNYRDLDVAMNHVVDQHLAQIVTNSYGYSTELLPPGYVKPFEDTLIQAAIEGIGVYFSSGDNGDGSSRFGFATTDWPPSSPWVTAVGGTSLGVDQTSTRVLETGWGTSDYSCDTTTLACTRSEWLYGAGGGVSQIFAEPQYQVDAGLSLAGRGVPDVAALGDPQTGLLVGQTQAFPDGNYYDEYRLAAPVSRARSSRDSWRCWIRHGGVPMVLPTPCSTSTRALSMTSSRRRRRSRAETTSTALTPPRAPWIDSERSMIIPARRPNIRVRGGTTSRGWARPPVRS